jgi:hypothetical protein
MHAGYDEWQVGILFTFTLLGDLVLTLYLTTQATRLGRRFTLLISALGKVLAGSAFALANHPSLPFTCSPAYYYFLLLCGTIGVLTPTGGDIGPFKAVEQAALAQLVGRTREEVNRSSGNNGIDDTAVSHHHPHILPLTSESDGT